MKNKNQKTKRILILIPFIIIPVVAAVFWIIKNGGKELPFKNSIANQNAFNEKLPEPSINDKDKTKLEIYMQAKKDSAAKQAQLTNEEIQKKYYDPGPPENKQTEAQKRQKTYALKNNTLTTDANELRVNEHLQRLYAQLDNVNSKNPPNDNSSDVPRPSSDQNIDRLEKMLSSAQKPDTAKDTELNQIDTLLNKMLDIAHPERVEERIAKEKTPKTQTFYTVYAYPNSSKDSSENKDLQFYDLETLDLSFEKEKQTSTIMAVIHEDKWVHDGSSVKIRLLQDVYVNGICIPHGSFIYGQCALGHDRVAIFCKNISYNNIIYPISLTVFDLDGIEGINAPGAISSETTKEGLNQGVQNMQLLNVDPSIGAQAAAAGVQTAKTLLSKKIKTVQVKLKSNHNILLKTSNI